MNSRVNTRAKGPKPYLSIRRKQAIFVLNGWIGKNINILISYKFKIGKELAEIKFQLPSSSNEDRTKKSNLVHAIKINKNKI